MGKPDAGPSGSGSISRAHHCAIAPLKLGYSLTLPLRWCDGCMILLGGACLTLSGMTGARGLRYSSASSRRREQESQLSRHDEDRDLNLLVMKLASLDV